MKKATCAMLAILGTASTVDAKTLVAYYSRTGNTAALANIIQAATNADIFEIKTADANYYPAYYNEMTTIAKQEIADNKLVPINEIPDLSQYDTIFIGSPIWWGTMATPVRTFLSQADLTDKTVASFITHGGGGAGTSHDDIAKITPHSRHVVGMSAYGDTATAQDVSDWVKNLGETE